MVRRILKSSLLKSSGIYTVTSIIGASIPFLLIPILTRVFSKEDYGIVSMAALLINIVTPFIGVSAHGAIHRKYFEESDSGEFSIYVGNSFVLLGVSSITFLIIFLLFGSKISEYTSVPASWLFFILIIAVCQFITLILLTIWQVKVKPLNYGLMQIAQSILNVGLSLFFIYQLNYGWESRVLGQLIAVSLTAIISLYLLAKLNYVKFSYNKTYLRDILSFSLPLIPHTLGGLIIAFTDRLLITNMLGVGDTGVYTVAFQIGSVLGIVNAAFNSAYIPWLYQQLNDGSLVLKVKIVKLIYVYFCAQIIIVIIGTLVLPSALNFFLGNSFQLASSYTGWILLGYAFNGMYLMVVGFIFYEKKTGLLAKITFAGAIINLPVCYFCLQYFGTMGAGISMVIIYFLTFISTWVLSAKVHYMPWNIFIHNKA